MEGTYLCIASGQNLANLIPAIMLRPEVIYIVSSQAMQDQAEQLEVCIRRCLPESKVVMRNKLSDTSFEEMQYKAIEIESEILDNTSTTRLVYNSTGGNKLMSTAFSDTLATHEICYADTQHDCLLYLKPEYRKQAFSNELDVEIYLMANGLITRRAESDSDAWQDKALARKSLSYWLAKHCQTLGTLLSKLNRLVNESVHQEGREKVLKTSSCHIDTAPKGMWEETLDKLEHFGLIDREDSQTFRFQNLAAAEYVGGKWLEEYAWLVASNLNVHDVRCGLQVTTSKHHKDNIRNELDCVLCHHNRLLVIECKTGRFGNMEQKDSDVLYKLSSLGTLAGGTFGKQLLLSAQLLDHTTATDKQVKNRSRADTMSITPLDGDRVIELERVIKHWMKTGELLTP